MPLFEYLCESCGLTVEAIQAVGEAPLAICDRCGGPLKKLLSAPAVQFKGTGWYVSDYGKSGSSAPRKSDPPAADAGKPESSAPKDSPRDASKTDPPKKDSKKDS
jgi:putative FmdB family regulatory protein